MTTTRTLNFALPSGRILDTLRPMFNDLGLLPVLAPGSRKLMAPAEDFPWLSMIDVKPSDVPEWVQKGTIPFGICGPDVWEEMKGSCRNKVDVALELPGNPLRFSFIGTAVQQERFNNTIDNLDQGAWQGIDIASKYTNLARFCAEDLVLDNNARLAIDIFKLTGKVELAPLLDGMIAADLIETGSTLKANDLVEIRTLRQWNSYYVLVNKDAQKDERVQQILQLFRENVKDYAYNPETKRVARSAEREAALPNVFTFAPVSHGGATFDAPNERPAQKLAATPR